MFTPPPLTFVNGENLFHTPSQTKHTAQRHAAGIRTTLAEAYTACEKQCFLRHTIYRDCEKNTMPRQMPINTYAPPFTYRKTGCMICENAFPLRKTAFAKYDNANLSQKSLVATCEKVKPRAAQLSATRKKETIPSPILAAKRENNKSFRFYSLTSKTHFQL